MRAQLMAIVLVLLPGAPLQAQDHRAEIIASNGAWYPEVLKAAGIHGTIRLVLTVLPGDTLAADGIKVIATSHPGFIASTRRMVAMWTYRAAVVGGHAITDSLTADIEYQLPSFADGTFDTLIVGRPTRDSTGTWRVTLGPLAIQPAHHPVARALRDSAAITVARVMAMRIGPLPGGGAPIVCVSLRSGNGEDPLTPAEWSAIQLPGIAMVHPRRCPPSFGSMAYVVGRVDPPGPGPVRLSIDSLEGWERGWVVAALHLGQHLYDCAVRGDAPSGPVVCRSVGYEVY